jgi:Family of unknown function (DUF7009)
MKLRIKGNSLRLRVSRSEVARLLKGERVEETIHFAPQKTATLTYALEQELSGIAPTVRYTESDITVYIPADWAIPWCLTDQVGIAESISLGITGSLDLLIEKDFACLDRNDEDNQDTFANPNAGATC